MEQFFRFLFHPPSDALALMVKDARMFWRDTAQWGQTLVLLGLLGVYIINLRHFTEQLDNPFWVHLICYLNLGACALNLATLTTRFVYPQFSMEGKRLWIIGMAPLGLGRVLRIKFWLASRAALLVSLGLILLSSRWENLLWRLPQPLSKAVAPSLAAILATAPLSIGAFGKVATGGIVAATLSGPIVLLFMWSLLAASLLGSLLPFLDPVLSSWHQAVHALLLAVMRLGARFPAIVPETKPQAVLTSAAVVLLCLFVYAYPYGESAFFTASRSRRPNALQPGRP